MKQMFVAILFVSLVLGTALPFARPAMAANLGCWDYNGSVMRITERLSRFRVTYVRPREDLRPAGVRPGTVFASGITRPRRFEGVLRRYSRHCPGQPLTFEVEGEYQSDTAIIFWGRRAVYDRCEPTPKHMHDQFFLDYIGAC